MSCPYCEYDGTEESYCNENLINDDGAIVSLLYDRTLAVWLPDEDGCLCIKVLIPVDYCPKCGRRLT